MEQAASRKPAALSGKMTAWERDVAGETFDDFRLLRVLGEGGMGRVYLAEQISLKRKVAIKVLREDIGARAMAVERFRAESQTVALLSHANVVQAYMVGEHMGRHYLVLEYVDGVSLRQYLAKKGPLEIPLALSLMRQVASGLQRAGELGILHRDIKPENILLTRKAEAKVTDFGLARCLTLDEPLDLTRSGAAVGTPRYMSPEQVEGKPVDQRTDIYSFGVTCYEMLTGQRPFDGTNGFEIALKHVREEAVPMESLRPEIPASICAIVRKMMAKNPEARYDSARSVLKDLAKARAALGGTGASTQSLSIAPDELTAPAAPSKQRPASRRWGLAFGAGALVLLLVGAVIVWSMNMGGAPAPSPVQLTQVPPVPVPPAPPVVAPTEPPPLEREDPNKKQREAALKKEEALKQSVEQILKNSAPNPGGVDACIELGVLYLEDDRVSSAEALFKRMSERKSPSPYHFVGRLGLAVTDFAKNDDSASHAKFKELFDPHAKDHRAKILNDILKRNAKFDEYVNAADQHDARHVVADATNPKTPPRSPLGKLFKFRKP